MANREIMINSAIADYYSGVYTSVRATAKAYGLPRSTLADRIAGSTTRATAHQFQQRLTPEQEEFLVEWILEEEARGYAPSHPRVREMASRILQMNGDTTPVGKRWIQHFIQRNPRVASIIGRPLEAARSTAATQEQIRAFLELFERTRIRLGIRQEDIWNIDKTGIGLGVCTNTRVLGSSLRKKTYIKSPENRE